MIPVTVIDHINAAIDGAKLSRRRVFTDYDAPREFSLAITALEDAAMRYTRGRAMEEGCFKPADLDKP